MNSGPRGHPHVAPPHEPPRDPATLPLVLRKTKLKKTCKCHEHITDSAACPGSTSFFAAILAPRPPKSASGACQKHIPKISPGSVQIVGLYFQPPGAWPRQSRPGREGGEAKVFQNVTKCTHVSKPSNRSSAPRTPRAPGPRTPLLLPPGPATELATDSQAP